MIARPASRREMRTAS